MKTNHHVKSAHHVVKRTHELFKNSKICNYTNALLLILILSIAILGTQMFLNSQNKVPPEAEIRFTELSKDRKILGTIMPASCESAPFYVANGDGNFTGCTVVSCWNGTFFTPAKGETCPPRASISSSPAAVSPGGYFNLSINSQNSTKCQMWVDYRSNGIGWDSNWNTGLNLISQSYNWPVNTLQAYGPISYAIVCYNEGYGWGAAAYTYIDILPPAVNIYFSDPNAIDPSGGGGDGGGDNGGNGGGDN